MRTYLRPMGRVYGDESKPHIKDQHTNWRCYHDGQVIGYVMATRWGWTAADTSGKMVECWHIGLGKRAMFAYLKGKLVAHHEREAVAA